MTTVTVAAAALQGTYEIADSVRSHLNIMEEAASRYAADMVIFPEVSLQGYPQLWVQSSEPDMLRMLYRTSELVPGGRHVEQILGRAADLKLHVVFGVSELGNTTGAIYNTAVLGGPEGYIGKYRKVHLATSEQLAWRQGNDWPVFDTEMGRVGVAICYDKVWPESCRELTLRGSDILVSPAAWSLGRSSLYRLYDRARAAENCRWMFSSNYAGELGGKRYAGSSQIVDPSGQIVATTGHDAGIAVATVDIKGGIASANADFLGARLVRDRRPETYLALNGLIPTRIDA